MKRHFKTILVLISASLWSTVSYGSDSCQLKVGWMERPSYQYKKLSGKPAGFDIEYIQRLTKQFNCEVSFRHMPWIRQAKELELGNIDLMLGAIFTAGDSEIYLLSDVYRRDPMGFYTLKSNQDIVKMKTVTEVFENGFKFGLTDYDIRTQELTDLVSSPKTKGKISMVKNIKGLLRNLQLRRLEGVLLHSAEVDYLRKTKDPLVKDLVLVPHLSFSMPVAMVVRKKANGSQQLIDNINKSIAKLKNNGSHEELLKEFVPSHFDILK